MVTTEMMAIGSNRESKEATRKQQEARSGLPNATQNHREISNRRWSHKGRVRRADTQAGVRDEW